MIPTDCTPALYVASNMSTTVKATKLQDLTPSETILIADEYKILCSPEQLTQRALAMLESQRGMYGGQLVDLYEHGLQTATR